MLEREIDLVEVTSRFLQVHSAWAASPDAQLTEEYETSVELMLEAFEQGDIPERCRALMSRVDYAKAQWNAFQGYRSLVSPLPRDAWWAAVESLLKEVEGFTEDEEKLLEPVKMLLQQNVPLQQIAHHIYGHNGVGPFLRKGVMQPQLILQEAEAPGSIVPADFVHPMEAKRRAERAEYLDKRLKQTRALAKTHADAPETLDELITQGVSPRQISQMKGISINDVLSRAAEMGKDLKIEPGIRPPTLPVSQGDPGDDLDLDDDDDMDDEDDLDDESDDSSSDVADELDRRILALSQSGKGAAEIAKELNVTTQKAAAVVRAHKARQPAATTETQATV